MEKGNVYYFLGNFHQHISHALPLYRKIGGTIIVMSKRAEQELKKNKDIRVRCIEDKPKFWLHINEVEENNISKTIDFLNSNADIVIFYDAFYWGDDIMHLSVPTIFLGHGNGSSKTVLQKDQEDDRWGKQLNNMTKVASLGRDTERMFLRQGVKKEKLIRTNTVRTDEIINKLRNKSIRKTIQDNIGLDATKKTIAYMPTYWGPTSVMDMGFDIVKNIPDKYNLLFWPHPQTPKEILDKYRQLAEQRSSVCFVQDDPRIEISDVYCVADAFIVDHTTSVVSDIMITKKPIVYSFGVGKNYDYTIKDSPIRFAVEHSWHINSENISNLEAILVNVLTPRYHLKQQILNRIFIRQFVWLPHGGAMRRTIRVINKLITANKGRKSVDRAFRQI